MIVIERESQARVITTDKEGKNLLICQASINSDGNITLRNYNACNKNSDEIIILSDKETQAIFKLMKVIGNNSNDLPF